MHRQPHGVRGGRLDWTKARKVAVLQRQLRLPNSYRSWIHDSAHHFLLLDEAAYSQTTLEQVFLNVAKRAGTPAAAEA